MPRLNPRVVILGAGFGGLEATKTLRHAPVEIILIDRQNYHCFQPLLYQVATAALSPADIAWPIRHILRRQKNATVFMAEVNGIDIGARVVNTKAGPFSFDFLVIATGARNWYFGHDRWAELAPGLKRIEDATRIRRNILSAFEEAELPRDDAERNRLLTFVIIGGGPTGVEMAGAIAEVARQTLARDFRRIDPRTARIVLIEAGPRLLPTFSEQHSSYARDTLVAMGVDVMTLSPVLQCDERGVDLASGRIEAGSVIWAAGIMASPAAQWLSAEHDRGGRVVVRADLSLQGFNVIFVIGDTASVKDASGRPVPGLASAAKQMGNYIGKLIAARVAGQSLPPFRSASRRCRTRSYSAQGLYWLDFLERSAHLLSNRHQESFRSRRDLAVELRLSASRSVEFIEGSAERIPLEDASDDTVVTTWRLCSIPAVLDALHEIRRA